MSELYFIERKTHYEPVQRPWLRRERAMPPRNIEVLSFTPPDFQCVVLGEVVHDVTEITHWRWLPQPPDPPPGYKSDADA